MKSIKESFLKEVLQYIKSKEAKVLVQKELSFHLRKSKAELESYGMNEEAAEEKAVRQMGSPAELGQQLNKLHRPKVDWILLVLFVAALGMGFLPLLSIQEPYTNLVGHQAIYIVIGALTALTMMYFDYRKLEKWCWLFLGTGVFILLALILFPTHMVNGSPYIRVVVFNISEMTALPFLFLFWAAYLSKKNPKFWLMTTVYVITTYLFLSLPALSVVMIYSLLLLVLFWASATKRKTVYLTTTFAAFMLMLFAGLFWLSGKPYQKERLLGFLNAEADPNGAGYMYIKIKELMTNGGWFGNEKFAEFWPEMSTDFAFVNVTYIYGWIVAGILVLVLLLLAVRMGFMTNQIKDRFGKQLVIGAIALFTIQFLYNIGMSLGFLPIISISLPFISYGLTPAVLNSFVIGIALSVYRRKDLVPAVGSSKN